MIDELRWLQGWYRAHCDGDWEHSYGVKIETLDNPGWQLAVDLVETELAGKTMAEVKIERTDDDWLFASIEEARFYVRCGPLNLAEAISLFRRWTEHPDQAPVESPPSPHIVE